MRNCRVQINREANQGYKMDYLTPARKQRALADAPLKPYDWEDIVRRSKLAKQQTKTKERTFITHLNLAAWSKDKIGFNTDGSRIKIPKSQ